MCRKMKLGHLLIPHRRINSKWIKELNVRIENHKKLGSILSGIAHSNFYWIYSQAREIKEIQMGLYQTKKFMHSKGNHQKNKKTTHKMGKRIHQCI